MNRIEMMSIPPVAAVTAVVACALAACSNQAVGAKAKPATPVAVAHAHMDRPLPPLPATVPAPVVKLVAALTAKDPKDRPGDAMAVAEWARHVRDYPQVIQSAAGPIRAGVSLSPAEPARRTTTSPRRRFSGFLLGRHV